MFNIDIFYSYDYEWVFSDGAAHYNQSICRVKMNPKCISPKSIGVAASIGIAYVK